MHRGKEILIYLLFVTFSCLVWWLRAANKQWERQSAVATQETEAVETNDTFTEKKIDVPVDVQDVPKDKQVRIFPSKITVYLRVRLSDYDKVNAQSVHVWCTYPSRALEFLSLHADVADPAVLNVRIQPEKVEYLIEQE